MCDCPFCEIAASDGHNRIVASNEFAFVIRDGFPVSDCHSLVIPFRHVGSFFDLTEQERTGLMALLDEAKNAIEQTHQPAGYNIGINDGAAAGQTVPHVHLHIIPRYESDSIDPRGGIRWVIPNKAKYWKD